MKLDNFSGRLTQVEMMSMRTQKKTKCITASVCRRRGHEAGSLTAPSRPLRGLSSCSDRDNILLKQIDRLGMKEP